MSTSLSTTAKKTLRTTPLTGLTSGASPTGVPMFRDSSLRMLRLVGFLLLLTQLGGRTVDAATDDNVLRIGNDILASMSGVDVAGAIFLIKDRVLEEGTLFAFSAYFRHSTKMRFQIWRPVGGETDFMLLNEYPFSSTRELQQEDLYIGIFLGTRKCMQVHNGDRIGVYLEEVPTAVAYVFDPAQPEALAYRVANLSDPITVGSNVTLDPLNFPYDFSVSAYIYQDPALVNRTEENTDPDCPLSARIPDRFQPSISPITTVPTPMASGKPGATGATGPVGATGATGPAGSVGPTGSLGGAGATGATGPTGSAGSLGPIGASGGNGSPGGTGATGPEGPRGFQGDAGSPGPAGTAGKDGLVFTNYTKAAPVVGDAPWADRNLLIFLLVWLAIVTLLLMIVIIIICCCYCCCDKKRKKDKYKELHAEPAHRMESREIHSWSVPDYCEKTNGDCGGGGEGGETGDVISHVSTPTTPPPGETRGNYARSVSQSQPPASPALKKEPAIEPPRPVLTEPVLTRSSSEEESKPRSGDAVDLGLPSTLTDKDYQASLGSPTSIYIGSNGKAFVYGDGVTSDDPATTTPGEPRSPKTSWMGTLRDDETIDYAGDQTNEPAPPHRPTELANGDMYTPGAPALDRAGKKSIYISPGENARLPRQRRDSQASGVSISTSIPPDILMPSHGLSEAPQSSPGFQGTNLRRVSYGDDLRGSRENITSIYPPSPANPTSPMSPSKYQPRGAPGAAAQDGAFTFSADDTMQYVVVDGEVLAISPKFVPTREPMTSPGWKRDMREDEVMEYVDDSITSGGQQIP